MLTYTRRVQILRYLHQHRTRSRITVSQLQRSLTTTPQINRLVADDNATLLAKQHELERFDLERQLKQQESPNWNSYQFEPKHELAKLAEILTHSGFERWKPYQAPANPFVNTSFPASRSSALRYRNAEGGIDVDDNEGGMLSQPLQFHIGQKIMHKRFKYRGVIIGWDPACYQAFEWILIMHNIAKNSLQDPDTFIQIQKKPHYHVLVDATHRPNNQITYCMQDNLELCTEPDEIKHALLDHYFTGFDENKACYKPLDALSKLYPDDNTSFDDSEN